jgi:AraC-like DNA-binding protein
VRTRRAFELHIRLCEEWSIGDNRRRVVARCLLLELLLELLAPPGRPRDEAHRAMTLAERTRRHLTELADVPFCEAKPIKESLRELGTSYYHQERVFKSHYGLSPSDYVSALRLEKIKALLRDTDLSVTEVARRVGFEDVAYFSRFVSKHAGASPRALRRKLL